MPEQEYLPPRPPGGPDGPGPPGEVPPPWANLSPVRPARPRPGGLGDGPGDAARVSAGYPMGSWQTEGAVTPQDAVPSAGPRPQEQLPPWAGPDADDEEPSAAPPRALGGRAVPSAPGGRAGQAAPGGRAGQAAPGGRAGQAAPGRRAGQAAPGGRAGQAALRRRRRRWLFALAGLVAVAGAAAAVVLLAAGGPGPAPVVPGALITTFQPGELRQVPDACQSVPAATVQHFLPGDVKVESALPVDGTAESACNWTVDQAPVYRLLQLNLLAYAPNGLASGNGSATFAAIDAYESALAGMQNPPEHSADPRATVTTLGGLGNEAFSARQVFRRGGAVTDVATVVVRYHNVVVTATMNGLQHSNRGTYGPVSMPQLASAALAFAQAAEATLH